MQTILLETRIAAPALRVFFLSLSVDLHLASAKQTEEHAVAGITRGLMKLDDEVTWQGRHFGVLLKQTSRITKYEPPYCFEDTMTKGGLKAFRHLHYFNEVATGTLMRDELFFRAPLGVLGILAEHLLLNRYLTKFLQTRNAMIQQVAESDHWKPRNVAKGMFLKKKDHGHRLWS